MVRHWRKFLTLGYPLAVLCWTLPSGYFPLKANFDPLIAKPFFAFNIWQAWDMFAPQLRSEDIWVEVTATDHTGQMRHVSLTNMIKMPYFERWQKERWRKYFNDHLRTDFEHQLWEPFAEYTARTLRAEGFEPSAIELIRWWRPTSPLPTPELRADRRNGGWNHYKFYTWTAGGTSP